MISKQQVKTIVAALSVFIEDGAISELRVRQKDGTFSSGIFNDLNLMAKAAAEMARTGFVLFLLNPIKPDRFKVTNRLTAATNCVTNDDIERRRWLFLDFDAVRKPATPATFEEHQRTMEVARKCRKFLKDQGWGEPIVADSGNGTHLYYRVDQPNDAQSAELQRKCLELLSLRSSSEKVKLDCSTFTASHLARVFGTLNAKGKEDETRFHNLSRIVKIPAKLSTVSIEQLTQLASFSPQPAGEQQSSLDVSQWVKDHQIEATGPVEWGSKAQRWILKQCPWNPEHRNRSAYIVQFADGGIAAGCLHTSCKGHNWRELRGMYESDVQESGSVGLKKLNSSQLIELVQKDITVFNTPRGETYASISVDDVPRIHPVVSEEFRRILRLKSFAATGTTLRPQVIQDTVLQFDSLARFRGTTEEVFLRTAKLDGMNYLDLADNKGRAIAFDSRNWTIASPAVRFRRGAGMLPLPEPTSGGDIQELRSFLNLQTDEDWLLFLASLVAAFFHSGPFPIVGMHGPAGSAKSTGVRVFRGMVDPNVAPSRGLPSNARDLMIAAHNGWIVCFDNLSHIAPWLSDCLCSLSTRMGFSTRQLYTDSGEVLFEGQRPIVLNGIEELATRPDLADRSIVLELPPIKTYTEESRFWKGFELAQPKLLGALLEIAVQVTRELPSVKLSAQPRMADFARLGVAMEPALKLKSGTFLRAYMANRMKANQVALEASPIGSHICELAEDGFSGTATRLLEVLNERGRKEVIESRSWPKSPKVVSGMLKRLSTALKTEGVEVEFQRDTTTTRNRIITLQKLRAKTNGSQTCRTGKGASAFGSRKNAGTDAGTAGDSVRTKWVGNLRVMMGLPLICGRLTQR